MGPPSYMRSVVDRNIVIRRIKDYFTVSGEKWIHTIYSNWRDIWKSYSVIGEDSSLLGPNVVQTDGTFRKERAVCNFKIQKDNNSYWTGGSAILPKRGLYFTSRHSFTFHKAWTLVRRKVVKNRKKEDLQRGTYNFKISECVTSMKTRHLPINLPCSTSTTISSQDTNEFSVWIMTLN
jgi:hypothetical protein